MYVPCEVMYVQLYNIYLFILKKKKKKKYIIIILLNIMYVVVHTILHVMYIYIKYI